METLDLLEDLLADYEGTLILVSHDRDFVDRLATSTIALDGRGRAVETPGGWTDFRSQNPGFFDAPDSPAPTSKPAPAPGRAKVATKLSYKDQRRLEELERRAPDLAEEIAALELRLADPALYTRDPKRFQDISGRLDAARAEQAAAEEEWFELETRREALEGT